MAVVFPVPKAARANVRAVGDELVVTVQPVGPEAEARVRAPEAGMVEATLRRQDGPGQVDLLADSGNRYIIQMERVRVATGTRLTAGEEMGKSAAEVRIRVVRAGESAPVLGVNLLGFFKDALVADDAAGGQGMALVVVALAGGALYLTSSYFQGKAVRWGAKKAASWNRKRKAKKGGQR